MKILNFVAIYLLAAGSVVAAVNDQISSDRKATWTAGVNTGVIGGIPHRTSPVIDVTLTPYFADNTGATSATAAVQAAIDASSSGDVIYLPAGTYRFDAAIAFNRFQGNRTIRGAGMSTIIKPTGNTVFALVGETYNDYASPASGNTVSAGHASLNKGSTSVTISDASIFVVGDSILLRSVNDNDLPVLATTRYPYMRGQMVRLTGKSSNTLTFFPPLAYDASATDLTASRNYDATDRQYVISGLGFEDMYINAEDSTSDGTMIFMVSAYGCWLRNVKISNFENYGVKLIYSLNCEIRHSYIGPANSTIGPNHQGLNLANTCNSLIEDNIFYSIFPHIQLNDISTGNVFAYNFIEQNASKGSPEADWIMGVAINTNHAAHPQFNLYEGNIASKLQSDGYWGSNSDDTVYRNWLHATNLSPEDPSKETDQFGAAIWMGRMTRRPNIVGNVLGRSGETQIYSHMGVPGNAVGTSTTSNAISGSGSKTFTTQSGLAFTVGNGWEVKIWSQSNPDNYMMGSVTAYSGSSLTLSINKGNGSGTHTDWEFIGGRGFGYSDRFLLVLGLPNMGNGSNNGIFAEHSRGAAHTWADWPAYLAAANGAGPGPSGFQELDLDVHGTMILKGNYNFATTSIPANEALGGDTLPDSLYRETKPAFFGTMDWPPFDASAPGTFSYERIPAGYRYVNGGEAPGVGGSQVEMPSFSPAAGTYGSAQTVTIDTGTPGATLYYTINGDTPTTSSTLYTGPVTLPGTTTTLKAIGVKAEFADSDVRSGTYTISGGGGAANATVNQLNIETLVIP